METDPQLEQFLQDALEQAEQRQWKRDNPYVADLIAVLAPHKTAGLERQHVISAMRPARREKELPIPKAFDETIQSAFQGHSAQYATFRGHAADDDLL